jgi:hypothetical protein
MPFSLMTESLIKSSSSDYQLCTNIDGYFIQETTKSVQLRIHNGPSLWIPKQFIDSEYVSNPLIKQNFYIENWILKKIGFRMIQNE